VRGGDEPPGLFGGHDLRELDVELDTDHVGTVPAGEQAHPAVDRHVAEVDALPAPDGAERALEARGVPDREELLGVRSAALVRRPQLDVELAVGVRPWPWSRPPVTVASAV
jgi:hypothetical protein